MYAQPGVSEVEVVSSLLLRKREKETACGQGSCVVTRIVKCRAKTIRQIQELAVNKVNVQII
jgi:hypothetical protein